MLDWGCDSRRRCANGRPNGRTVISVQGWQAEGWRPHPGDKRRRRDQGSAVGRVRHADQLGRFSDAACRIQRLRHRSKSLSLSLSLSLSVLTAIFPGKPRLAGFVEAKDDGGGGDNWTTGAISREKLQSNHNHQQTNTQ